MGVFVFPPILAGGIPLSFPLLAAFGVPLNIAVSSSQPIEITCNGTEGSIQQCQIVRLLHREGLVSGLYMDLSLRNSLRIHLYKLQTLRPQFKPQEVMQQ